MKRKTIYDLELVSEIDSCNEWVAVEDKNNCDIRKVKASYYKNRDATIEKIDKILSEGKIVCIIEAI